MTRTTEQLREEGLWPFPAPTHNPPDGSAPDVNRPTIVRRQVRDRRLALLRKGKKK